MSFIPRLSLPRCVPRVDPVSHPLPLPPPFSLFCCLSSDEVCLFLLKIKKIIVIRCEIRIFAEKTWYYFSFSFCYFMLDIFRENLSISLLQRFISLTLKYPRILSIYIARAYRDISIAPRLWRRVSGCARQKLCERRFYASCMYIYVYRGEGEATKLDYKPKSTLSSEFPGVYETRLLPMDFVYCHVLN